MDLESVKEFIRSEVPDWDDEVVATARFKAFSGQRSDWEVKFQFWRDLIIKVSRRFGVLIIDPVQVCSNLLVGTISRRELFNYCIFCFLKGEEGVV